jgi:hypothetical protein
MKPQRTLRNSRCSPIKISGKIWNSRNQDFIVFMSS